MFRHNRVFSSPMMGSLFLLWLLEIHIFRSLALFIVHARANLRAVFRLTISVFETPVPKLEVAPLCVPSLPIVHLLLMPPIIWVQVFVWEVSRSLHVGVVCRQRQTLAHVVVRVGDLASVAMLTVMI